MFTYSRVWNYYICIGHKEELGENSNALHSPDCGLQHAEHGRKCEEHSRESGDSFGSEHGSY